LAEFHFPIPPVLLSSETYDMTFSLSLKGNVDKTAWWTYVNDTPSHNDGCAYLKDPLSWTYYDIDFKMRVVDPGPVYPSEVNLGLGWQGGEFTVEDVPGQRGNGTCRITTPSPMPQGGFIQLIAATNSSGTVYFNVSQAESALYRNINAMTSYQATPGQPVSWNVTVDATGEQGFPEAGAGKFINVTVPADWQNTTTGPLNGTEPAGQYLTPSPSFLFEATNGTWTIMCSGPNVLQEIEVYSLYLGWSPVKVSSAVVGDNLTVKGSLASELSGTAKLAVVRGGEEVFTNQTGFSGGVAELGWQNVSEAGSYKLVFLVECGLEVGLLETDFQISEKAPCSIHAEILDIGECGPCESCG